MSWGRKQTKINLSSYPKTGLEFWSFYIPSLHTAKHWSNWKHQYVTNWLWECVKWPWLLKTPITLGKHLMFYVMCLSWIVLVTRETNLSPTNAHQGWEHHFFEKVRYLFCYMKEWRNCEKHLPLWAKIT